jgi:hypothetical protein
LLARLAASLGAKRVDGGAAGYQVEPGDQRRAGLQPVGRPCEGDEGVLRDFLGELRRPHLTQRRRINEIHVPVDERREGGLRAPDQVVL